MIHEELEYKQNTAIHNVLNHMISEFWVTLQSLKIKTTELWKNKFQLYNVDTVKSWTKKW